MEHERNYKDKEVTVYFKIEDDELILVTTSARYGSPHRTVVHRTHRRRADATRGAGRTGRAAPYLKHGRVPRSRRDPTAPTSERQHPVRIGYRDGQFS